MSRILARALGDPAGPDAVRPRLPTMFEPGLDLAGEPGPGATGEPGPGATAAMGDIAAEAVRGAGVLATHPGMPRNLADPALGPPLVPHDSPRARQPAVADEPTLAPSPSPRIEPDRGPVPAGLPPTGDARLEHPVRPHQTLPPLASSAEPAAPRSRPAGSAAHAIVPILPPGPAPALTPREPTRPRQRPDASPAPRRFAARQASGAAPAEPTVHISIGRVEIRASQAAAQQQQRRASRPRPPSPDLADYLRQRGRQR
jgi:hypothetical protein